jgi:hypothetical protein
MPAPPRFVALERTAVIICALALAIALILLISGFFTQRDPALLVGSAAQYGQSFPDQGDGRLAAGAPPPRYDSQPPTSGPHRPAPVRHDYAPLSDDQLLSALAAGDVVVEYGGDPHRPPPGLRALAARLAGPFSPTLVATGQALILAPRPGTVGLIALAWTRIARVSGADQPLLREFIAAWLGRGAPTR